MPRISSPQASRPQWYDRNAGGGVSTASTVISEDTADTERFSFTVPADTKTFVAFIALHVMARIAATSSTTTDELAGTMLYTPSGAAALQLLVTRLNTVAMVAGEQQNKEVSPSFLLQTGDELAYNNIFQGDAAGAGRGFASGHLYRANIDE